MLANSGGGSSIASSRRDRSNSKKSLHNANRHNTHNRHNHHNDTDKSAYTIESLTAEVENAQIEINEVLAQAAHVEAEFNSPNRSCTGIGSIQRKMELSKELRLNLKSRL